MSEYLFIGAHVDEEICFAGTMIKLLEEGHTVSHVAFDIGTSNEEEFKASSKIIGSDSFMWPLHRKSQHRAQSIADDLHTYRNAFKFVFTHSINDRHSLHRMVAEETKRVINGNLFTYLAPWNGNEDPNYFVELSEKHLEKKIEALKCYKSQAHRSYMSDEFIRAQAVYNGIKCGKRYAEAFRIERYIQ